MIYNAKNFDDRKYLVFKKGEVLQNCLQVDTETGEVIHLVKEPIHSGCSKVYYKVVFYDPKDLSVINTTKTKTWE